jgi:DnaJ-class molecular chaperone
VSFVCPVHGEYFPLNTGTSLAVCPACQIDVRTRTPAVPTALWQTCPVCQGRGHVPGGFYGIPPVGTGNERCRRCAGTGTIEQPTPTVARGNAQGPG